MAGYVYALRSETSRLVKLGRTDQAPMMRLREINATPHYAAAGPWHLAECREVLNAVSEEAALHRRFAAARSADVPGATELFAIDLGSALGALQDIPATRCTRGGRLTRFREDHDLRNYLSALFRASGLENFYDIQGSWTLSHYPSTMGGRYLTLNIDRHEVAFSTLPGAGEEPMHVLALDALAEDYEEAMAWLRLRGGQVEDAPYESAKEGAILVGWTGPLADAIGVFDQPGVRRALVAYWYDTLLPMPDQGRRSPHARHHDYNAVAELFAHMREQQRRALGR